MLNWLPRDEAWSARVRALATRGDASWDELVALAQFDLDFVKTDRLDKLRTARFPKPPPNIATRPIRLAVLGTSTISHLVPAIRVGALRRNLWLDTHESDYGQIRQALMDPGSSLRAYQPDVVLLAFDARTLTAALDPSADLAAVDILLERTVQDLANLWRLARDHLGAFVLMQTVLPVFPAVMGSHEHVWPGSKAFFLDRLNVALRQRGGEVGFVAVDTVAALHGLAALYDPVLWHRAKQEITPLAAPLYGDLVGRLLGARQGLSKKCLVLDLDDTLWGGVVGDDGLEGITIGLGSALGEAFLDVQSYAKALSRRGVILAICSKNDETTALKVFDEHPDMVLRRDDIACFVANWSDKATNIRAIAKTLSIGVDSLVFLDDNPFERKLVREALPSVAVPEVPDDPALVPACLAAAGYFEALTITGEDRERTQLYAANKAREALRGDATDLTDYLAGLEMQLESRRFDAIGLERIVQLINKTNQFNLTTQRYTLDEVRAIMEDPSAFGLQLRLKDCFGDNGIVAIVIGRVAHGTATIDSWLMSCRVLGRQLEQATLSIIADVALRLGARCVTGIYKPTAKNGMVANLYSQLGFRHINTDDDGVCRYALDLASYIPPKIAMAINIE